MAIKVTGIKWDTDGEDQASLGLPSCVEIEAAVEEDRIADHLSDRYGWCVSAFSLEGDAR